MAKKKSVNKEIKDKKLKRIKEANIIVELSEVIKNKKECYKVKIIIDDIIEPASRPKHKATFITDKKTKKKIMVGTRTYNPNQNYRNYLKKKILEGLLIQCEEKDIDKEIFPLSNVYINSKIIIHKIPPKNFSLAKKYYALIQKIFPTTKPDIDNYEKEIYDTCNEIIFKDDAAVCKHTVEKIYDIEKKTEIFIYLFNNELPSGFRLSKEEKELAKKLISKIKYDDEGE